jgi:hypothetical protein
MQNGTATLESSLALLFKKLHGFFSMAHQFHSLMLFKRNENICPNKEMGGRQSLHHHFLIAKKRA